ncbi:hypothetical protein QVD17_33415 [Tagetes erecta]|uniref:Uncharacterized protein n=1 Tax=Tagetes erecta TaxID=13708 RepID=A0AAD8K0Y4_TARER|nr:hypothetical protein QVD17_33415 [Tagetes erecta]
MKASDRFRLEAMLNSSEKKDDRKKKKRAAEDEDEEGATDEEEGDKKGQKQKNILCSKYSNYWYNIVNQKALSYEPRFLRCLREGVALGQRIQTQCTPMREGKW